MDSPQIPTDTAASPQPERQWVWRASLASRAAGKISVLACVETVFAVALYWWIAIRWDTHWHLVSSVFIAPLLLLRSPESIEAGVRWFLTDWFGVEAYKQWTKAKQSAWIAVVTMANFLLTVLLSSTLVLGTKGEFRSYVVGATVVVIALAVVTAIAIPNFTETAGPMRWRIATYLSAAIGGSTGIAFAGGDALLVSGTFVFTFSAFAAIGTDPDGRTLDSGSHTTALLAFLLSFSIRASFCRAAATIRFAHLGLVRIPMNYKGNCFVTDACIPAELIPGIRDTRKELASDGFFAGFNSLEFGERVGRLSLSPFLFLPAVIYRLNIKATAWFWWPLAFLLRPVKQRTVEADQKVALCWPWTNPFQMLVFVGISLLALVVLFVRHVDPARWGRLSQVEGVWTPVKALLALNWSHIPPWHWAILISAVCSVVMLALAGGAVSCSVNKKWPPPGLGWKVKAMEALVRIRSLATVALLVFSLGALFIAHTPWHAHVPLPQSWYSAMKKFYRVAGYR